MSPGTRMSASRPALASPGCIRSGARWSRLVPILAFLAAALAPFSAPPAAAQSIRVAAGGRTAEFAPIGAPASYSAEAFRALGADVAPVPDGFRILLLGDTLRFWTGSPFFTAHGAVIQLAHPVTADDGRFLVPGQLLTEWLPTAYQGRLTLAGGVLTNTEAKTAPEAVTPAAARQPAVTRQPAAAPPKSPRIVILDPGHGGADPGKIGPNGIREKDAVLQLARTLRRTLEARGYEVHLTRTTDTLIALDDRPHLANQWKNGRPSSVFVSLHFNSFSDRSIHGFETFFLSQARTEDERRVAEMENSAAAFESEPRPTVPVEEAILNGLRNDFYVRASSDLADDVQRSIAAVHDGPDRGIKRAGFRVLVGALMPAVLVEAAFISNPTEANAIGTPSFQQDLARSIADAIDRFFDEHEHLWAAGGS